MLFLVKLHPAFLYTRFVGHFFFQNSTFWRTPDYSTLDNFWKWVVCSHHFRWKKSNTENGLRSTSIKSTRNTYEGSTVSKRTTSGVLRLARKHGTIIRIKAITYYWLQSRDDFSVEFVLIFVLRRKLLYFCQTNYRHGPKYHEWQPRTETQVHYRYWFTTYHPCNVCRCL